MVAAIDIGNTNLHAGLFRNQRLFKTCRFPIPPTPDLSRLKKWLGRRPLEGAGIASVNPDLTRPAARIFRDVFNIKPLVINERTDSGLKFGYLDPRQMGSDRIANMAGGRARFPGNLIIVSFGTATVIDAVLRDGCHPGGVIMPGIDPALDVLADRAVRLKRYPARIPDRIIGRTTAECVQNGVIRGTALAVQGYIRVMKKSFRRDFSCLATGGWARLMSPLIPEIDRVVPELSLWGVYYIYRRNA